MKILKSLFIYFFCIALVFNFTSCEKETNVGVYFMTDTKISTFDPQLASTKAELSYAYNCFDCLFGYDKDGNLIKNPILNEYSVSDDGLTYTFTLYNDTFWNDTEILVTAADFEFGLKRAVAKETKASFAGLLSAVSGFDEVNQGGDTSELGVSSSGKVLTIKLSKKDDGFLNALAHPISAPCNEEYFVGTKGKYGLDIEHILSNGPYFVKSVNENDSSITMHSVDERDMPLNYVKIIFNAAPEDITLAAKENTYNIYTSSDDIFLKYTEGKGNTYDLYDTTYCLYASENLETDDVDIAKMLFSDIDKSTLSINLTDYAKNTDSIIASDLNIGAELYKEIDKSIEISTYDKPKSLELRGNDKETFDYLSDLVLYYPNNSVAKTYASLVTQTWQKDLNAYINIQPYDISDLDAVLNPEDEDQPVLAIIPVTSSDFTAKGAINNLSNYNIGVTGVDYYNADGIASYQQTLIDNYTLYPLFETATRYITDGKISFMNFTSYGGVIDFRYLTKAEE